MELKLNIYGDRFCRKLVRTATVDTFDLSTAVCSDVIGIIKLDMLEGGGLSALSAESQFELVAGIVKDGFPFFVDLIKDLFELTSDEVRNTKIEDIISIVVEIVRYSVNNLKSSLAGTKTKN